MRGRTIELEVTDKRGKAAKTIPLYQYDYGQKLLIKGVELPEYYEVHFSNQQYGDAITVLGDSTGVLIPDSLVATGETIYVWLFLHDTSYDGETEYMGAIPVIKRAQPTDVTPTPEEQSIITEVIAALNNMEDDMSEQVQAAEAAKEAAQTAQAAAEGAATTASGYVDTVTAAQSAAEAAQAAAETAATSATASATSATSSANSANNALAEATNAKIAAVDAASAASTSATTATTASGNASNYATSAESAKVDAVAAQTAAEAAQTAAETAQGKAEDAQGAAETAQTAAEAAQTAAEAAQTAAETAQGAAETAQGSAEDSAEDSEAYAVGTRNGVDVESDDPAYENNAKYYAEEAATVLEDKLDAPATAGTAGQVLTSDGEGGQAWVDPSGAIDDTAGSGDTDVTWSADKLDEEFTDVLTAIHGLAPAATDYAKGAVASFYDGANNLPLNHLKVQIVPVQAGSGDPSPTNKRNITGRTGQTISHSAEDTTNPTEYEDSWEDEAGTVFYGKRDIITGQLIVEAIMLTFDGSSDEGWTYKAYNDYNKYRYYISVSSYGVDYGDNKQDVLFCNWLRPEVNGAQTTYTYGTNIVCMSPSRQWLFIALDISTLDALKAELALNPLQVVIKLATPSTYSLAPVEIDSLYGVNKFWSDAGNIIQCEYKADTSLFVKDEIDSREVSPQIEVKANALEDDTIKVIEGLMIRKNLDIEFKAMITDFTSLTIGHGFNEDAAAYIVIDDTNVTAYANTGSQKMQYAHGLTIGTYIRVLIQQDDRALARVSIFTASGKSVKTDVDFNGCVGDIFATVSGELTDVSLIAVLHDINKPIWFFGDSYQAVTKTEGGQWPYYLREDGYMVNTLFSGKFGAFAQTLVPSFHKLIAIKKPKFVVWCLGMNGSDTNGNLNMQWRDATNDVISTCAEEGITLILATIPNTPDRINTQKNAYVKNTGLRYIDFAKAVGAEEAGSSWYTGMLSSDDLHPSNTGAMALYAQILADLPEVMQNVQCGYDVWEGGSY